MKKFISPLMAFLALTSLVMLTGCPKPDPCEEKDCGDHGTCVSVDDETAECQCDEGWEGELCQDSIIVPPPPGVRGTLDVIVQRYNWQSEKWNSLNGIGSYAVLGKNKEDMYYLDYEYNEELGKLELASTQTRLSTTKKELFDNGTLVFDAHSEKDAGTDNGKSVGVISLKDILVGTYYMHVFDPQGDKYVSEVTITESAQGFHYAQVQPLVSIKIIVGITEVVGSDNELDSVLVEVYGSGNDTFNVVGVKDYQSIPYEPFYQGRTRPIVNQRGNKESGAFYLWDIPKRGYRIMAYEKQYYDQYKKHAFLEVTKLNKNGLNEFRVCWKGCNN